MKPFYGRYWEHEEELEDFSYKWPAIKKFIPQEKNIKLLDFGCGKGRIFGEMIKINPFMGAVGVDISEVAIKHMKKKFPKYTFLRISEGERLPFASNSFDFITILDVVEHIYDTEITFKELSRILKYGGKILITVPYYGLIKNLIIAFIGFDTVYDPRSAHIRSYTKKSLLREIKSVNLSPVKFGYFGRFCFCIYVDC